MVTRSVWVTAEGERISFSMRVTVRVLSAIWLS
jgi:hypothetical protein